MRPETAARDDEYIRVLRIERDLDLLVLFEGRRAKIGASDQFSRLAVARIEPNFRCRWTAGRFCLCRVGLVFGGGCYWRLRRIDGRGRRRRGGDGRRRRADGRRNSCGLLSSGLRTRCLRARRTFDHLNNGRWRACAAGQECVGRCGAMDAGQRGHHRCGGKGESSQPRLDPDDRRLNHRTLSMQNCTMSFYGRQ